MAEQKISLRWVVSLAFCAALLTGGSLPLAQAATKKPRASQSATPTDTPARDVASRKKSRKTRLAAAPAANPVSRQARAPKASAAPLGAGPIRVVAPAAAGGLMLASSNSSASFGQRYGLHATSDPLELKSSVALVLDQDTNEVLFSKNSDAVLPIASLTKLMTAMVVVEARLPMDEMITVTQEDVDTEKFSSSRLAVGTVLSREEALHLALMSSENRAAHALGRTYPGGLAVFVAAMNAKALQIGMRDTRYVDPTGLNSRNQASARDLASLVKVAYQQPTIREMSTSQGYALQSGSRQVQFRNTNSLVKNPSWDIGLQKTGYIVEAGRCLVMQARMAGRKFIMVFLDSSGKYSRQADAERVRHWIERTASVRSLGDSSSGYVMPVSTGPNPVRSGVIHADLRPKS